MANSSEFEKLEIWQLSFKLSVSVYKLTSKFPKNEQFSLTDQIKRSVTSVGANIAESSGRYHYKDKINFLYHARGSLLETKSHLMMAQELFNLDKNSIEPLLQEINVIAIKLNNFIKYLTNKQ